MAASKVYNYVTERIISLLDKGVVPWHKPWNPGSDFPRNVRTKKPYRGSNVFMLWAVAMDRGFESPWWGTWKAWEEKKGIIKEEEKTESAIATFFKFIPVYSDDTKGLPEKERDVIGHRPLLRYFRVWNAVQLENYQELFPPEEPKEFDHIEEAEKIMMGYLNNSGPKVHHGGGKAAYYPTKDKIVLPKVEAFNSIEEYWSTANHEAVHSTGHPSRLDRKEGMNNLFGDHLYSFEELVAEMGAAMLCAVAGIENKTIDNSAAYIASWMTKLGDNTEWIVRAGGKAQKAVDCVLGVSFEEEQDE